MIFRLLTEADVRAVLTMDNLIEAMTSALGRFSAGDVVQPVRTVIPVGEHKGVFGVMPAYARNPAALGAKLVTVFDANAGRGLPTHLAIIALLEPETGAMLALLDGRYSTEARTAAPRAVSSRLLARTQASSLAIMDRGPGAEPSGGARARPSSPPRGRLESKSRAAGAICDRRLRHSCPVKAVDHAARRSSAPISSCSPRRRPRL
jgi:ornithine cyclodeaminase/alanine dehydrogenase-like protein (mu-crystallin family)